MVSGTTQYLGVYSFGGPGAPNAYLNVYDGARRMWTHSLSYSNRMLTYFTNVEIRAFGTETGCTTSCAQGSTKLIKLDPGSAYTPQARVLHEMGHIASYLSNRDQERRVVADYCYPSTGDGCTSPTAGWMMGTAEWSSAAFEEALATLYGDVAINGSIMTDPHTCNSTGFCSGVGQSTEASPGVCPDPAQSRFPMTNLRYLWDAHDSNLDFGGETIATPYSDMFDTVNTFNNGTANREKDEPWCCAGVCWACDLDGRSAYDFKANWLTAGTDTGAPFAGNCSPGLINGTGD